jgi:subtilase family serine protease
MKMSRLLLSSALVAASVVASPALAGTKSQPNPTPAAPNTPVAFEVLLPLRNQAGLEALMQAQQTPGSPQYHAWLTPTQFAERFGPSAADVASVESTLLKAGLSITTARPRSFHVVGDAAHVGAMLHTTLHPVTTVAGAMAMATSATPTLPAALQAAGAKIVTLTGAPMRHPMAMKGPVAANPDNRYTAAGGYWFDDLKQAYSYPAYSTTTALPGGYHRVDRHDGSGVRVAVLMEDQIFPGDVAAVFNHEKFTALSGGAPIPTVNTVLVDGGGVVGGPGTFEASLDVQQVTGGAPGSAVTLVSIPDLSDDHIMDGYTYIVESNDYDIVNSSFGECELEYTAAYNSGTDLTYILQAEHELYVQGNVEGITFVASSGDEGAPACPSANYGSPGANPTFVAGVSSPADDPNVTAVGGGNLITSVGPGLNSTYVRESAFGDPESPYDIYGLSQNVSGGYWGAGGGVSSIFAKPSYQTLVNSGSGTYRTVPDVGMLVGGLGFSMINGNIPGYCQSPAISCSPDDSSVIIAYGINYGGYFTFVIGTSVSSPEFVGALALYEQHAGRQGNVNTFLYSQGAIQTAAGGVSAPAAKQYFHRGQPGFDGIYNANFPSADYNYIYGNGSPDVAKLFGLTAYGLAGTPQTSTNP